jgi:hypothetical protein
MPAKAQWYSTMSRGCRFYRIPPRKPAALRRGATCRPPPAKESRPRATALNFREITCCGRSDGVIVMVYEVSPVCLVRRSAGVRRGWWCRCGRLGCARSARRVRDVRAAIPGLACTGGGNGTAASRYTRRYTHDLEQQRRSPITCALRVRMSAPSRAQINHSGVLTPWRRLTYRCGRHSIFQLGPRGP